MSDIVTRLRKAALKNLDPTLQEIVIDAADEIERLRSDVRVAREMGKFKEARTHE